MSDGPHRSLPMLPGWKRVAEFSDNTAFTSKELANAIVGAVEQDLQRELQLGFLDEAYRLFRDHESSLFKDSLAELLEDLREDAGSGIGKLVLELSILVASRGGTGREGFAKAIRDAATDRAARGARQVEEHYLRRSSEQRAKNVRTRIESAISEAEVDRLSKRVLKLDDGTPYRRVKRTGLDDGVSF